MQRRESVNMRAKLNFINYLTTFYKIIYGNLVYDCNLFLAKTCYSKVLKTRDGLPNNLYPNL